MMIETTINLTTARYQHEAILRYAWPVAGILYFIMLGVYALMPLWVGKDTKI